MPALLLSKAKAIQFTHEVAPTPSPAAALRQATTRAMASSAVRCFMPHTSRIAFGP